MHSDRLQIQNVVETCYCRAYCNNKVLYEFISKKKCFCPMSFYNNSMKCTWNRCKRKIWRYLTHMQILDSLRVPLSTILTPILNRPISQIQQCVSPISHNEPFCNRNVHLSVTKWCIVGYMSDAFWDLWDGSGYRNIVVKVQFRRSELYMEIFYLIATRHSTDLMQIWTPLVSTTIAEQSD